MGISSPGIGSGLDINGLISKLMAVEAQPLKELDAKETALQGKISALGSLNGAVTSLQSSLSSLSNQATYQSVSANASDSAVLSASATSKAVAGSYAINVKQMAQSQALATAGKASTTAAIGGGGSTTLTFRFGTVSGGVFGIAGSNLSATVASNGIADGSLSLNGVAISTDSNTKSAKALAAAINAKSSTSGVTATASTTATSATLFGNSGASTFGDIDTSGSGTYSLSVGGVEIASQASGVGAGSGVTAASLDATLAGTNAVTNALAAANITFSGNAADGSLQFFSAEGANLTVAETISGTVTGGIGNSGSANSGSTVTTTASVTLASSSATPITVAGNDATLAGLVAGAAGSYIGSSFAADANQSIGTVTIDSSNNSLQGIRDAINKANIGVSASIISDGSGSNPYHLVISSTKSGASSTLKIDVGGSSPDATISDLLSYDAGGTQKLNQISAAQSTKLTVNGIEVSSNSNTVTDAIQGVSLTVSKTGTSNLTVARDTGGVKSGVQAFVKAYNEFNTTVKSLISYDPATKKAGPLLGDSTAQLIQTQVKKQLSTAIPGLSGSLSNLSQIGIAFQKDGSLSLDSAKLSSAMSSNYEDIIGLFAAIGDASDSLVSYTSSSGKTKAGTYAVDITSLATQGKLQGSRDLRSESITIASGTAWSVTLNGTSPSSSSTIASVAIPAGTYSASDLASLLQSAINGASNFSSSGASVSASINDDGLMEIKSGKYGSVSNISIANLTGSTVEEVLGSSTSTDGADVAGSIGGVAATGSGQFLTGGVGADAEGLKIEVTGGNTGARGTISFSQGYAFQLNTLASSYLGNKGLIANGSDGLKASVTDLEKTRDRLNDRLSDAEKRYRKQFTALDVTLSRMNSTSQYLQQQLASLANNTK
ncbi:flagellar filament capping protein FliD [Massilia sp. W12]|uniref:flagellar filament capping protein FliD n=1 Tax=Massilia sp. W12 TaxID=3126507 RepID=UPI0030CA79C8